MTFYPIGELTPIEPIEITDPLQVTPASSAGLEKDISWTADGIRLFFTSDRDGTFAVYEWNISTGLVNRIIQSAFTPNVSVAIQCPEPQNYNLYLPSNLNLHVQKACLLEYSGVIFRAMFNETSENRYLGLDEIETLLPLDYNYTWQNPQFQGIELFRAIENRYDHRYMYARSILNGILSDSYLPSNTNPMGYFAASYASSVNDTGLNIVGISCDPDLRTIDVRGTEITYCTSRLPFQTWYTSIRLGEINSSNSRDDIGLIYRRLIPHLYTALFDEVYGLHDPVLGGINGVHLNNNGDTAAYETDASQNLSLVDTYFTNLGTQYVFNPLTFQIRANFCTDEYPLRVSRDNVLYGGDEDAIVVHALFVDPNRDASGRIIFTNSRPTVVALRWVTFKFQFRGSRLGTPQEFYPDNETTFNPINTPIDTIDSDFERVPNRQIPWCQ